MGGRLAHEQEMPVHLPHRLADRLVGEPIIAEIDGVQAGMPPPVALQPAPDRPAFAVLLLVPILRHDEFRLQRHHAVVVGRHDRRRQHRMEIFCLVLAALVAGTVRTMHLVRHVIFRVVQGDQHVAVQPAEAVQAARPFQRRHHLGVGRMEVVGAGRVQHRPDMVVAGDPVEAEQRLAIRPPLALLQTPLMRQGRRALQKKQGKRRQTNVRHRVTRIPSLPNIRQHPRSDPTRRSSIFIPGRNHLSGTAGIPQNRSEAIDRKPVAHLTHRANSLRLRVISIENCWDGMGWDGWLSTANSRKLQNS